MTQVVTEFTAHNSIGLHDVYMQACEAVSNELGVDIIDYLDAAAEAQSDVDLAVYSADVRHIFGATCRTEIDHRKSRQNQNPRMAFGVAATGSVTEQHVDDLVALLGPLPSGSFREVAGTPTPADVYRCLCDWLRMVVRRRRTSERHLTLAAQGAADIDAVLPTSPSPNPQPYGSIRRAI